MRTPLLLFLWLLLGLSSLRAEASVSKAFVFDNTDTLKTLDIAGSPFCVGASLTVPFYTNVPFSPANIFTVQLSTSTGSFSVPRNLGSAPGTSSGSIRVTLPSPISTGTGYRIRVVASKQPIGMVVQDNGQNITIGNPPAAPLLTSNSGLCAGSTLNLSASSISGATYTWTGPNGFTATGRSVTRPRVEVEDAGTYTVTALVNGCSSSANIGVTVKPALADAGPDILTCPGQSVQLGATGGISYSWAPSASLNNATIATPIATPAATTTYTVTVTNENGCVRTDQVVVTVSPLPAIVITPSAPVLCAGSSVQLQAAGAVSYSWSPAIGLDDPTSATPVASPAVTTIYTVTGISAAGCVSTKTVTVNVRALPISNAGFDRTICSGQVLTMGGTNTSSGTYLWEPATGLSSATVRNPVLTIQNTTGQAIIQTYKLTTTTTSGCVSTDEVVITVNPAIPANAGPDANICAGGSTQLKATGGVLYKWSPITNLSDPNSANPVAFPTFTTRYIVTVTNEEGCSRNDTVFVNVSPVPAVTVTPAAPAVCIGNSVQLTAAGPAVTYAWSPAVGLDDPTSATPIASPLETTTYTVIGYSAAGCASAPKTVTVRVNPYPVANAGPDKVVCAYQGSTLGAPGVAGYSYQWSPATGLNNPRAASPTLVYPGDNLVPIKVEYTLTVTSNGCVSSDVVEVVVNPSAYAGPAVSICSGGSTQLRASGGVSYQWSPAIGLSDPTIADPVASPAVTTTYTVTVTSQDKLCKSTASVRVTVNTIPTVTASASTTDAVCPGIPVTLTAAGAATYSWFPATGLDNPNSATPVATPTTTTTYTVTGRTAAGCTSTAQVTVAVKPTAAIITPSGPTSFCQGGSVALTSSPAVSYLWSTGETTASITVRQAGSYSVTTTNGENCSATSLPATVVVFNPPAVTFVPITNVCQDRGVFMLAGGSPAGGTYSGQGVVNNQFNTAVAGAGTHTITYTFTDENGCSASATQNLTVGNCLGVEDNLQASSLAVYPSPAQNELTVTFSLLKREEVTLLLTDLTGTIIFKTSFTASAGEVRKSIPVHKYAQGLYLLQYRTAGASNSKKVVIAR